MDDCELWCMWRVGMDCGGEYVGCVVYCLFICLFGEVLERRGYGSWCVFPVKG